MTNGYQSYRTSVVSSLVLLFILLFLLVTGCSSSPSGEAGVNEEEQKNTDGEDERIMTSEQSFPELAIPPIDHKVPDNLETATLALG
ncbi:MAG: hypothetical protein ACQES4_05060 [Bacillota bacterium]